MSRGDRLDVCIGDSLDCSTVTIINQVDPDTATFDEHKVVLGGPPSRMKRRNSTVRASRRTAMAKGAAAPEGRPTWIIPAPFWPPTTDPCAD